TAGRRHSHVDVSVQKQRLAYLHRMATTGEMAATLAHDLKQPLQAIKSYSGATTRMLHADKPITEIADIQRRISDQADNARSVVDNVRDFVGHQDVGLVQIDLNNLLNRSVSLIESRTRKMSIEKHL